VAASLPSSAVSGAKLKAFTTVTVSNATQQPISGRVTVTVYVSPAQSLEGATKVTAVTQAIKLKPGKSKAIKLKIGSLPAGLSAGNYFLVAAVRAPDGTTTGEAGPTVLISAPMAVAKVTAVRPVTASATPGKSATLALKLTDAGTAPVAGTAALTVSLSADPTGAGGQAAAPVPLKVKLAPKAARTFRVKFVVPTNLSAGRYFLSVSLNVAALGDPTAADGTGVSAATLLVK
jgi:uncharacterized membrane protein